MFLDSMQANYDTSGSIPSFAQGNPLAEALRLLPGGVELVRALWRPPAGDFVTLDQHRDLALMQVSTLRDMRVPSRLAEPLASRINSMIVNAYARRNPLDANWQRLMTQLSAANLPTMVQRCSTSEMLVLSGDSGMGKTSMIRALLDMFPRCIHHTSYAGKKFNQVQVPVISIDAPINGSIAGLILSIGSALDEALDLTGARSYAASWNKRFSIDALRTLMARALATHAVGLIHVDDFQRVGERNKTATVEACATIIGLANVVGSALIISGTPDMNKVLETSFEAARRATSRGTIRVTPAQSHLDPFHMKLMEKLFDHQLQKPRVALTDSLSALILNIAGGNIGTEVNLYVAAQEEAIRSGRTLSENLFKEVFDSQFSELAPALARANRRRTGKPPATGLGALE